MIALILPCIQKRQADTRDYIVSILTENWPLTTKTIFLLLTRKHGIGITYQAVQKTVKQLLAQGIVVQLNKKYYLNSEWIQQVKKFVTNFEENYLKSGSTSNLSQEDRLLQALDREEILSNKPLG